MINKEYLDIILSLFDKNKQKYVLALASQSNNVLDTIIIAYVFHTYNFLPNCLAKCINHNVISKCVNSVEDGFDFDSVSDEDISVSNECCLFIDKLISFSSNKSIKCTKKNKQDLNCTYMAYLFLTDKSLLAYELFQNCLDSRDYSYVLSKLKDSLSEAYDLPTEPIFSQWGRFLTDPLSESLQTCIGREKEISDLVDVLSKKKKNNPVLIGQPGVGKTAIVEGFAKLLMSENCPKQFIGYHIYEASISSMIGGSKYRGDFEERIENLLKTIVNCNSHIILFIDEIHSIMSNHNDSGGSSIGMSFGDILKPYMSKPGFLMIGTTTEQEYRIIEKDKALGRRFSPIHIKEPNTEAVAYLLENIIEDYSNHFSITINNSIIPEIIKYANNYIPNRYMPDKALDLLDESCVHCLNHTKNSNLTVQDVVSATEVITGVNIPTKGRGSCDNIDKIINHLNNTIIGQQLAIDGIASVIKRYFLGFAPLHKPIGSFLFVGPTGVGKTQLCKELASSMFTKESFIRFDMSEFMESHSVSKLVGSPPGYIGYGTGGLLTNAVNHNPYSVILFDEIEKAHPDVFNILLQVLDDGVLTDSEGFTVNFDNCIIILTSNVGSSDVLEKSSKSIGFENNGLSTVDKNKLYENAVRKKFKPEFINRLDRIVYFNTLTKDDIKQIVNNELGKVITKFKDRGIYISVSNPVKSALYDKCYSPEYGARYAQRLITSEIEDLLVNYLVDNELLVNETDVKINISKKDSMFLCTQEKVPAG